jgi:hypothetical protein
MNSRDAQNRTDHFRQNIKIAPLVLSRLRSVPDRGLENLLPFRDSLSIADMISAPTGAASSARGKRTSSPGWINEVKRFDSRIDVPSVNTHSAFAPLGFVLRTTRRQTSGIASPLAWNAIAIATRKIAPGASPAK